MINTSKLEHTTINERKHESILRFIQVEMRILMVNQRTMDVFLLKQSNRVDFKQHAMVLKQEI